MSSEAAKLEAIFLAERGRLQRLIGRIVGDRGVAEDLVHDTYLKVSAATTSRPVDDHRAYLVRAAINLALDHRRRLRTAPPAEPEAGLLGLADRGESPESATAARQALAAVAAALDRLPERTRHAFALHRFEERTLTDIARELGVSTALVHKLVTDAYTAIRAELKSGGFLPTGIR